LTQMSMTIITWCVKHAEMCATFMSHVRKNYVSMDLTVSPLIQRQFCSMVHAQVARELTTGFLSVLRSRSSAKQPPKHTKERQS